MQHFFFVRARMKRLRRTFVAAPDKRVRARNAALVPSCHAGCDLIERLRG
jgi:hypothetical protein